MRFGFAAATLLSLASCVFAQDTDISTVVAAFQSANVPAAFGIPFAPIGLLQATYTRNGVQTRFSSGTQVNRDATAQAPTFKAVGLTDPGPYVIAMVDPDGGQFGHVRHWLQGGYNLNTATGDLTSTTAAVTAYFQPSPGAGQPSHRYVFWLYKQSQAFVTQRLVTPQTFIGNWNLTSFANQVQLGQPVAATFMLVRQ